MIVLYLLREGACQALIDNGDPGHFLKSRLKHLTMTTLQVLGTPINLLSMTPIWFRAPTFLSGSHDAVYRSRSFGFDL